MGTEEEEVPKDGTPWGEKNLFTKRRGPSLSVLCTLGGPIPPFQRVFFVGQKPNVVAEGPSKGCRKSKDHSKTHVGDGRGWEMEEESDLGKAVKRSKVEVENCNRERWVQWQTK